LRPDPSALPSSRHTRRVDLSPWPVSLALAGKLARQSPLCGVDSLAARDLCVRCSGSLRLTLRSGGLVLLFRHPPHPGPAPPRRTGTSRSISGTRNAGIDGLPFIAPLGRGKTPHQRVGGERNGSKPQRGDPSQPRPPAWVRTATPFLSSSPERACQNRRRPRGAMDAKGRPFRAPALKSLGPFTRADGLGWDGSPLWGSTTPPHAPLRVDDC